MLVWNNAQPVRLIIVTSPKRIVYEDNLLIDELSYIGWTTFDSAVTNGLASHIHPQNYEICYIVRGEVNWWVNDAQYAIKRGDFFLTKPGERHGAVNGVMQRCEIYWLQFPVEPSTLSDEMGSIIGDLRQLNHRAFPATTPVESAFHRLLNEHRMSEPHAALSARSAFYEILIGVVRSYNGFFAKYNEEQQVYSDAIMHALTWIDDHLTDKFTVVEIAAAVSMSSSYFQKRFLEEIGITPAEYCTRQRIETSQQLLRTTDQSIAELAHGLGFSTSQYFATVFKKYTGMTPREYRRLRGLQ